MKCPYCNKEMKTGGVHGGKYALKLRTKEECNTNTESYLCHDCKIVIINKSDE